MTSPSPIGRILAAVVDRLVPEDATPGAVGAGGVDDLLASADGRHARVWERVLTAGLVHLDQESVARHGSPFADLAADDADRLLGDLEQGHTTVSWGVAPEWFVVTVTRLTAEAFYGRRNGHGWSLVGYEPGPKRAPGAPVVEPALRTVGLADAAPIYDVVVLGAGPGGGVAARVLAEAGAQVLVAERGPVLRFTDVGVDHLANHRLPRYGINTPPAPGRADPRLFVDRRGEEHVLAEAWHPRYSAMPHGVGGGSRVYQGMAWRLHPDDFRLASIHGCPDGSSLADWPLTYDDLEPHYSRAEWELGVAGDGDAHPNRGPRSRPYPMPPPPWNPEAAVLQRGANRLGLATGPVPLLINTEPRHGRAACVQCGECVGFACPTDAKNGSHNALLPAALAAGRCELASEVRATGIETDAAGKVTGVELVDVTTGVRRSVRAAHVVVACGAIETARLLLASRSGAHPTGLGNRTDQVGRHLQGHLYVSAFGLFDEPVIDGRGPGVRIATLDHVNRLGGDRFGGGVLANEVTKLPILHWYWALPPDAARWGLAGKQAMRDLYRRTSHLHGPIQELPNSEARVTISDDITDRYGVPAARLSGQLHGDNVSQAEMLQAKAVEWMQASGATKVWTGDFTRELTAGQHQAGTCRMGDDPATSVTDPWGRVHGHDNLWVMDASLHVTNGGVNPVLTVFALAYRSAERLAAT